MCTDIYDHHISSELLVGRDNEISQIVTDVKNNKNSSSWLVTGESGVGKTAFLNKLYNNLVNDTDGVIFVGYYNKANSLATGTTYSITYPFNITLFSLINRARNIRNLKEKVDITTNRLKKALVRFTKEEGTKIAGSIIEDVVNKAGLKETFKVVEFLENIKFRKN